MKLGDYLKETRAELKHVTWPPRRQAIVFTVVVILISVATSLYLGLFDYLFSIVLRGIVQ